MTDLPDIPWETQHKENVSVFKIVVNVLEDRSSSVRHIYSYHDFSSPEDEKIARDLQSFGEEQSAFALLTETLRREASLELLVKLSNDEDYLQKYVDASEEEALNMHQELVHALLNTITSTSSKMASDIVKEVFQRALSRKKGES